MTFTCQVTNLIFTCPVINLILIVTLIYTCRCSNPSTSFTKICTWVNPGTNSGSNSQYAAGESELTKGQMVSLFGNLAPLAIIF